MPLICINGGGPHTRAACWQHPHTPALFLPAAADCLDDVQQWQQPHSTQHLPLASPGPTTDLNAPNPPHYDRQNFHAHRHIHTHTQHTAPHSKHDTIEVCHPAPVHAPPWRPPSPLSPHQELSLNHALQGHPAALQHHLPVKNKVEVASLQGGMRVSWCEGWREYANGVCACMCVCMCVCVCVCVCACVRARMRARVRVDVFVCVHMGVKKISHI
jgi:hypothetical protein